MIKNPPAFPNTGNSTWNLAPTDGMTLRDWFAGQALSGAASEMLLPSDFTDEQVAEDCAILAKIMFALADAMLAEREK